MREYQSEAEFLKHYDASKYDRPSVSVDTLVFTVVDREPVNYRKLPEKVLRVLLIRRNGHPYKDKWALPGGFVNMDENLETAALRELKEETILTMSTSSVIYLGDIGRDRTRVISCTYLALDSKHVHLEAGDDAGDAMWFDVSSKLIEEQRVIVEVAMYSKKVSPIINE